MLVCLVATALGAQNRPIAPNPLDEPEILILVPNSVSSLPMMLVERLDREQNVVPGARIRVDLFSAHPQALARLLLGDAAALLTGTSQGWENHLAGGPVVMLNTGVWGVSSMITANAEVRSARDLVGLRVALPFPGSPLDVQMRHIWRELGIDPDRDIEVSYSAPAQTVGLLLAGRIDAAPLPEPIATNLVTNQGVFRGFVVADAWAQVNDGDPRSPQVSLFATAEAFRETPAIYAALVSAWREASGLVASLPLVYGTLFAAELDLPAAVVAAALEQTILSVPLSEVNEKAVRAYFDIVRSVLAEERGVLSDGFFAAPE
jgi:NitT/TauT family transport system substrate-binding protein